MVPFEWGGTDTSQRSLLEGGRRVRIRGGNVLAGAEIRLI